MDQGPDLLAVVHRLNLAFARERDQGAEVLGLGLRGRGPDPRAAGVDGPHARRAVRHRRPDGHRPADRSTSSSSRRRAITPPGRARRALPHRHRRPRRAHLRQVVPRRGARVLAATSAPARRRRATRATKPTSSRCSTGAATRGIAAIPYGGGSSVVGGVEATSATATRGAVSIDLGRLDRVARDRPRRRARRASRPACYGPALEDQLRPHDLTLAPLPAVVRVLDARRLDRDALRRSLRDALHPHRRVRRGDCASSRRAGSSRRRRLPGSGAGPSPDRLLLRLRGHARRDHRGVDAAAGPTDVPRVAATARFDDVRGRRRRRTRDRAERPAPGELPAHRRDRGDDHRRGRRRARTSCSSGSSRPTTRSTRGSPARSSARATTAATSTTHRARADGRRRGPRKARPARGATRSCARRTPATRSSGSALVNETFETATHLGSLPRAPRRRRSARCATRCDAVGADPGLVTCRFTHVYPDGPAPYFTVIAAGAPSRRPGSTQWADDQEAAVRRAARARRARSPTTTPSGATTAPGTTASGPTCSPTRSAPRSAPLDPARRPQPRRARSTPDRGR